MSGPEYDELACFRARHEDGDWYCAAHGQSWPCSKVPWRCICGSGDDAEWHSLMCVVSNTPDDVWNGDGE